MVTKLYLLNEGSLAEAKWACHQNQKRQASLRHSIPARHSIPGAHAQGQAFGVCLAKIRLVYIVVFAEQGHLN